MVHGERVVARGTAPCDRDLDARELRTLRQDALAVRGEQLDDIHVVLRRDAHARAARRTLALEADREAPDALETDVTVLCASIDTVRELSERIVELVVPRIAGAEDTWARPIRCC
jgi:hypothetical protein